MNKIMVNITNLPIRSVTRIACTSFALLLSVFLISAFTLVNCAVAQDGVVTNLDNDPYSHEFYGNGTISMDYDGQNTLSLIGNGKWSSSITYNSDNRVFSIIAENAEGTEDITYTYNFSAGSSNTYNVFINPKPNLTFVLDGVIDTDNLSFVVDEVSSNYDSYSIKLNKCYSDVLNINVGYMGSNKTITLSGTEFNANEINLISGNVVFNTEATFNLLDSEGITLTASTGSTITVSNKLTFDNGNSEDNNKLADVAISASADDNAALKICCESQGAICAESVFISSGRVDIQGTLLASLEIGDSAIFSPGNSPGKTIVGSTEDKKDFTINDNALLLMEIGGSGENANDYLVISGDILLGSDPTIELVLADNNSLGLGQSFTAILTATNSDEIKDQILSIIKTSDFTDLDYVLVDEENNTYAITGRRLSASEVPEPSTWALLVLGAAGLLYMRKRETKA